MVNANIRKYRQIFKPTFRIIFQVGFVSGITGSTPLEVVENLVDSGFDGVLFSDDNVTFVPYYGDNVE